MEQVTTGRLRVTQVGSSIGRPADQRQTLVGLGLGRMRRTRILKDTPAVRGMLGKVHHLVDWEEIGGDDG